MNNGPEWTKEVEESAALLALEQDLTRTLRPVDLPAGFADRIVAAAQADEVERTQRHRAKVLPFRAWRVVGGGAIAAALLAGSFVAENAHQQRERAHERAIANQQFETATRITDQALEQTRAQLERAGVLNGE